MKHASDLELIELVAGRLPADRQEAVEAHLAACDECSRRRDAVRQTWDALGDWQIPAGRDLAPAVQAAAAREAAASSRRLPLLLRLAASILIAVGAGHVAGRLAAPALHPVRPATAADEEAAAESLSLGVLEQVSPTGLPETLLGVEEPPDEEVS